MREIKPCKGRNLTCDYEVGRLGSDDETFHAFCGLPAVLAIDLMGEGGSVEAFYCVRHALLLVNRINRIIIESTEEG